MDRRTFCGALLALPALRAAAQAPWPSKPVTLLVPGGTGGVIDIRSRWLSQRLSEAIGQPVILEYKPGAGGLVGMEAAARMPADGYTLIAIHQGTIAFNPALYSHLPYDPIRDFAPVARLGAGPLSLVANSALGVKTVPELIALARSRSTPLAFGSPGVGTPPHIAGELFRREARIEALHVPYKSGGASISDVIGGHIDFSIEGFTVTLPHVAAGRLTMLATTGARRLERWPDVPTVREQGLAGFVYEGWVGLALPGAAPAPLVQSVYRPIAKILAGDEAREFFGAAAADPDPMTPETFAAFIRAETARWGATIREFGIRLE